MNDKIKKLRTKVVIGYYGFWVKLTYLSVISVAVGIFFALGGNITKQEENYRIQIDALACL
jgi:hypothetical protein